MIKLFLSHSSKDTTSVLHLAEELRNKGITVWLDEWEIDVGESIPGKVEEGLENASHLAVWLTENSVSSGWVTKEWRTKIFHEISTNEVAVLPLLAEDCDMPMFLSDKKYADFRTSFHDGLSSLMRALNKQSTKQKPVRPRSTVTITEYTKNYLKDLEGAVIPFPTLGNLNIIGSLKSLPRSGKLIRLKGVIPALPIRSIYDHILSVAHSADCFLQTAEYKIHGRDRAELARIIAYHDITEVILGDIPQYTKLDERKRNSARVSAEILLSKRPNGVPERITGEFIALFLHETERQSLLAAMEAMSANTVVANFAYTLDKIDPIIGVWRYIHHFRNSRAFNIDDYIERMRNFFENPRIMKIVNQIKDSRMADIIAQLQNRVNAREYFENPSFLQEGPFSRHQDMVKKLIEGRVLEFAMPARRKKIALR